MSWTDDAGAIWTVPAPGSAAAKHATIPANSPWSIRSGAIYFAQLGAMVPGPNFFTPFTIMSEPLDGGMTATLAMSLPPNYPPLQGSPGNGPTAPVLGRQHVFWAEWWGEGGVGPNGAGISNWQLRAVAPSGGSVQEIDSFNYSAQSATFGTAPDMAADGVAVYWTSEGTLKRLCD
jgi:hypothetical protein